LVDQLDELAPVNQLERVDPVHRLDGVDPVHRLDRVVRFGLLRWELRQSRLNVLLRLVGFGIFVPVEGVDPFGPRGGPAPPIP
jgi:hypothetical protein